MLRKVAKSYYQQLYEKQHIVVCQRIKKVKEATYDRVILASGVTVASRKLSKPALIMNVWNNDLNESL